MGTNTTDGEKLVRSHTMAIITKVAERQTSKFLGGPARHFIQSDTKPEFSEKIKAVFQDSATLSYQLWTRRTVMRCCGLQELNHPVFDVNDPRLVPHTLVQPDEHEDQLKGRPITVMVHPLLEAYGTDDAEDYDTGRVWARAEVWLDSK